MRRQFMIVASAVVISAVAGCGQEPGRRTAPPAGHAPRNDGSRLFAAGSVWNRALQPDAPLDPRSADLTSAFVRQIEHEQRAETGPWIMTAESSTPVYTVPRGQRRVPVALDARGRYAESLGRAFRRVPLPDDARPAKGPDGHLTILQPSTDSLWEFWKLRRAGGRWRASWGGAMRGVSHNPGQFNTGSWPGGHAYWGASATSLPLVAGLIRIRELERGRIDHAVSIAIPNARADAIAWPAQRGDGTLRRSDAIPEGARFRLDPRLDLDALGLSPVVRAIARAVHRYGMIVRHKTLHATGFYAEDPTPTGANPYARLFDGRSPSELLASFPWKRLQLIRMRLRRDS
jgi:hypothetical protein